MRRRACGIRYRFLDGGANRVQIFGKVRLGEAGAHGSHPTSDIDPNHRGNDRAFGRDDGAYRRADSHMHIRHRRDPSKGERKLRGIAELLLRLRLERHTSDPRANRRPPDSTSMWLCSDIVFTAYAATAIGTNFVGNCVTRLGRSPEHAQRNARWRNWYERTPTPSQLEVIGAYCRVGCESREERSLSWQPYPSMRFPSSIRIPSGLR